MQLGKKVVVVGVSASGKSFFARELGAKTNLPVIFMDAIMWKPGWNYVGDEEVIKHIDEESLKSEWIIEGYITKSARPFLFERADSIIYLDYAPIVSSWRYIKRWWKHRKNARPELEGNPEKFSFKFLKLVWMKGETLSLDKFLNEVTDRNKILKLRSPRKAKDFLNEI